MATGQPYMSKMERRVAELLAAEMDNNEGGEDGRVKLKEKINFSEFLKTGETEFEIDQLGPSLDELDLNEQTGLDVGFSDESENEESNENNEVEEEEAITGIDSDKEDVDSTNQTETNPSGPTEKKPLPYLRNINMDHFKTKEASLREDNVQQWENVVDDGGITKQIIRPGNGKIPPYGCNVWIHYTVYYANDPKKTPIDSTRGSRNRPFTFRLFNKDVYLVLEYGVAKMEVKERAKFWAKPEYAYGPLGVPKGDHGWICKPNATVIFEVELLGYYDDSIGTDIGRMNSTQLSQIQFQEVMKGALQFKGEGNLQWQKEDYFRAFKNYGRGVLILERYITVVKEEDEKRNELLFVLFLNMAQCEIEKHDWNGALRFIAKAEALPEHTKGNRCKLNFRAAKAHFKLNHITKAKERIGTALNLEPGNISILELYEQIMKAVVEEHQGTKEMYEKMGKKFTGSV